MRKILVVDDDINICDLVRLYLENEGFSVSVAYNGTDALKMFNEISPDLIVLDVMLPEKSGMDICRDIRKVSKIPVVMLTAKGEIVDKILGLELGADDYIVKPFEPRELVARIKAVLRRTEINEEKTDEVVYPGLSVNISTYELKIAGVKTVVPKKELELLYFLASNPGIVFSRDKLLDSVWGYEFYGNSRTVDVHIHRLREKLDGVSESWSLKTINGVGYKFELK